VVLVVDILQLYSDSAMNQPFLHTYTPNKPVWHALEQNQNIHERVSRDFTPDYKSKIHLKGFQGTEMIR